LTAIGSVLVLTAIGSILPFPSVPPGLHGMTSTRRQHHPDEMKHPPTGALEGGRPAGFVPVVRKRRGGQPTDTLPLTIRVKG
jgi:hypothetical protein